jgi:hypothetical protein
MGGFYFTVPQIPCQDIKVTLKEAASCTVSFQILHSHSTSLPISVTPLTGGQKVSFILDGGVSQTYTTNDNGFITLLPAVAPGTHSYIATFDGHSENGTFTVPTGTSSCSQGGSITLEW